MAAVRAFAALPCRFEVRLAVAVFASLALLVAGPAYAQTGAKPPKASAVSQYIEMMPGAGGAKPSGGKAPKPSGGKAAPTTAKPGATKTVAAAGRANPVSAAFATSGRGLGEGALLAIILGAIAGAGALLFAVRRRVSRRQHG